MTSSPTRPLAPRPLVLHGRRTRTQIREATNSFYDGVLDSLHNRYAQHNRRIQQLEEGIRDRDQKIQMQIEKAEDLSFYPNSYPRLL